MIHPNEWQRQMMEDASAAFFALPLPGRLLLVAFVVGLFVFGSWLSNRQRPGSAAVKSDPRE